MTDLKVTQADNDRTVDLTDWLILNDFFDEEGTRHHLRKVEDFGEFCDQTFAAHRIAAEEGKAELVERAESLLAMIGQNDCRIYASDPPVVELRAALARVKGEKA